MIALSRVIIVAAPMAIDGVAVEARVTLILPERIVGDVINLEDMSLVVELHPGLEVFP